VDGARSDSDTLFSRVDLWPVSRGVAIAPAGFRDLGTGGRTTTVSELLRFFGSGAHVVCNQLSWRAWPRDSTSCWLSTSFSLMADDKVYSPCSSHSTSLIA